ncbi:MAG: glycerophosphodiester phosphodiesterase family protein, partial [Parvularculaceae bacterium]
VEPDTGPSASAGAPGWRLDPGGDLNGFFECLEAEGATLVSAHRGGPAPGYPENALQTFAATLAEVPAVLEVDVATSADGVLYLMHDDTLERTTTGEGASDALSWAKIEKLLLVDNEGTPTAFAPTRFDDALAWAKDRTILQVDFKKTTRFEDVVAEIRRQHAERNVIYIAYSLAQAERLHALAPDAMISLSLDSMSDLNRAVAGGVPADHIVAFTGTDIPRPHLFEILNGRDVEVIFGTLGGTDSVDNFIVETGEEGHYAEIAGLGVDILATDRPGAAQAALVAAGRGASDGLCGVARIGG